MPITVNGTLVPVLSGFCSNGQHEGTKPRGIDEKPLKVCTLDVCGYCECDCHTKLDQLFEMAGIPRTPQQNPEYIPYRRTFWMPSDEPDYGLPEAAPEVVEGVGVAVIEREVTTTKTGRTQRGGLEFWVQRECLAWLLDRDPEYGLPVGIISNEIGRIEGIKPPSQGAIAAVFDRWEKCGYARFEVKPRRFVGLTEQGEANGLEWCKAQAKKTKEKA